MLHTQIDTGASTTARSSKDLLANYLARLHGQVPFSDSNRGVKRNQPYLLCVSLVLMTLIGVQLHCPGRISIVSSKTDIYFNTLQTALHQRFSIAPLD